VSHAFLFCTFFFGGGGGLNPTLGSNISNLLKFLNGLYASEGSRHIASVFTEIIPFGRIRKRRHFTSTLDSAILRALSSWSRRALFSSNSAVSMFTWFKLILITFLAVNNISKNLEKNEAFSIFQFWKANLLTENGTKEKSTCKPPYWR
jgi:hypothetical protein